ncbi:YlzJ-like family protein [Oscillospiraceae bacterium PP1C4]
MVLHTIIPIEQVMQQPDSVEYQYKQMHNSYIQGVNSNGKFTVSRLISTNPKLYLDPHYAPGELLSKK